MNLEAIEAAKKAIESYASQWYMIPVLDDWGNPVDQEPGCADYSSCEAMEIINAEIDPEFESPYEEDGAEVFGVTVTVNWQWSSQDPEGDVDLLVPVWEQDGEWFYGEIERLN